MAHYSLVQQHLDPSGGSGLFDPRDHEMFKKFICQTPFIHAKPLNAGKVRILRVESLRHFQNEWDIPCIARVMVKITLSGGVSIVSQRAGWKIF